MAPPASGATAALARFVAQRRGSLPAEVLPTVKLHILDTLGCQVAFARLPWSRAVWRYAAEAGTAGPATISYYGAPAPVETAAFANAAFAHGFEMDDTEMRSASHPGAVVVPAALAAAQRHGSSGAELVAAVAVGYEVMVRVALSAVGMMRRGFHTTAVAGPFGAAAAAAALWSLDEARTAHALGIAASHASGITEHSVSGGSVKRVHAGIAARSGIESVRLARAGVTAPEGALDGRRGLLQAVADDPGMPASGLGKDFELLTTGLKPYCCCAAQHTVIDAVARLQHQHPRLTPAAVRRIRVLQNDREVDAVGLVTEPADITSAQFSAAFGIALRLVRNANGFGDYMNARLDDPELLAIARRVTYERAPASSPLPGEGPCQVSIELDDGSVLAAEVRSARGTVASPMSESDVITKFRGLAGEPLGEERADRVAEMVMNLERLPDSNRLARHLVARSEDAPSPSAVDL
ncbi:MmgE/PrpD family protein [Spirillospora sp. NPDC029432]|uniref:MmgE/PrpD family protein n=1 Tax=Spirillospora sp. NPDC029432 TaxID=3154599 RepID=UPI0034573972